MATFGIILLVLILVVIMYALMMNKGGSCCADRGYGDQPSGSGSCSMNASSCTRKEPENDSVTLDPVCGMAVDPNSILTVEHRGRQYRFCSEHCRQSFAGNPDKYL